MPQVPVSQDFGPVPVQPVAAGLGPLMEQVARGAEQIGGQILEARRFSEFTAFSGALTKGLNDLDLEFERNPGDPVDMQARYQEASQELLRGHLGAVRDPKVRARAERKAATLLERRRGQVGLKALGLERDKGLADLGNAVDGYLEQAAAALTPDARREALADARMLIEGSPWIVSEQDRDAAMDKFDREADLTRARLLVESGRFDEAEAFLDDPEQSAGLDELERIAERSKLETARARADRETAGLQGDIQERTAKDAYARLGINRAESGIIGPKTPEYTIDDYLHDLPNLSVSDSKTIFSTMNQVANRDDSAALERVQEAIDDGGPGVRDLIHAEIQSGNITQPTGLSFLDEDRAVNGGGPVRQAYADAKTMIKVLKAADDAFPDERAIAAIRWGEANRELQLFRETNPPPEAYLPKAKEILNSFGQMSVESRKGTLRLPFGSAVSRRLVTTETLDESNSAIMDALSRGKISVEEAEQQGAILDAWGNLLEMDAATQAVRSRERAAQ